MSTNEELIAEARRLEGDYGDNYEVMCHMSDLADALEKVTAERDDLESRLAELLCDLTDGRMSKTGYDVRTMVHEGGDGE